jgi:alcohol dehydrogenase class IV
MNALCLAPALRFNEAVVPEALTSLASALRSTDAPARVEELARLGGFELLRDHGIPEGDLQEVAAETAQRPGARSNPRTATPDDIEALLRSVW